MLHAVLLMKSDRVKGREYIKCRKAERLLVMAVATQYDLRAVCHQIISRLKCSCPGRVGATWPGRANENFPSHAPVLRQVAERGW